MSYLLNSPEVIKENLRLDSQKLKQSSLSIFKRRQYEAVLRHLTQSRIALNVSDDQKIQDYVHALLMLCNLGDLPRAKALLQLPVTKTKTLHEYFGHLGCYLEQCQVYEAVMDKFAAQIDLRFKAVLLDGLGWANGRLGKTDKAILLHEEALEIARDLHDQHIEVKAYYGLAAIYEVNLGDLIKSEYFYNKMLKVATATNSLKYRGLAILGKAYYKHYNAQFKQSINLCNRVLQIADGIDNEEVYVKAILQIVMSIVMSSHQISNMDHLLENLNLCLEKVRNINDKRQEAVILSNYINLFMVLQDLSKARECYQQSFQIANQMNAVPLKILLLGQIGAIYLREKNFYEALESLLAAHQLMIIHNQMSMSYTLLLLNIGYCYGCLKDFNQAITYAHKGLELAKINNNQYLLGFGMAVIANAHWQKNRYGHGIAFILYSFWIYPPWKHEGMRYIFLEAVRSIRNLLREKLGWFGSVTRKFHNY
ncbi:MAG: tetratricopeptide repeat protein [Pseudanabaenaceae cyanobacterium]